MLACGQVSIEQPSQQVQDVPNSGFDSWTLLSGGDDEALLACQLSGVGTTSDLLRFGRFGFHRYDALFDAALAASVAVRAVRVHVDATASLPLAVRLDVVRILPASTANPNATVVDGAAPRSATLGALLASRRSEAALLREFRVPDELPLVSLLGSRFFDRGFALELGFAADANLTAANVTVSVFAVRVELLLVSTVNVTSIAPTKLPTRLGGDRVRVAGSGFRFFGGFVCRFGELLALGTLIANGTAAPTPAPTPDFGDAALTRPPTPAPTSLAGNGAAEIECIAPRQRASGTYLFQLSVDGGTTFSDDPNAVANIVVGGAAPLPAPLPANAIIVRAKRNETQFKIESNDVKVDNAVAASEPVLTLELDKTYVFIADTHCDHPIYLSTGPGGSQADRPDDAVLPDRLDNGAHRETCEGLTFEFRPTISYPETVFLASTRNATMGRKIRLNKPKSSGAAAAAAAAATTIAMALVFATII